MHAMAIRHISWRTALVALVPALAALALGLAIAAAFQRSDSTSHKLDSEYIRLTVVSPTPASLDQATRTLNTNLTGPSALPTGLLPPETFLLSEDDEPVGIRWIYRYDPAVPMEKAPVGMLVVSEYVNASGPADWTRAIPDRKVSIADAFGGPGPYPQPFLSARWTRGGHRFEVGAIGSPLASHDDVERATQRVIDAMISSAPPR